jgi:phosphoglycerate dehydrogenase-like enzyme
MLKCLLAGILVLLPVMALADAVDEVGSISVETATEQMISEIGLRESSVAARDLPGWEPPQKVLIRLLPQDQLSDFQAMAPGVELIAVESTAEAVKNAPGAQAVIGFCSEEVFAAEPKLQWVQVFWAGVERCVANAGMQKDNMLLTNGQRIASPALAEHAIAMMMMLARGLDVYHGSQLKGVWMRDTYLERSDHMELAGRTVLVVGLGGIGTQVAKRAHGLGMRVIATRGSRREGPDYVEYVGLADELNTLARQADVVINTAPLTDRTRGIFNETFFDEMKSNAYFISVGRGGSTVTDDLVSALHNGSIAGAGLDVTDPEPLPEGHPLWSMPRVIISPHTAGSSDRSLRRLSLMVRENLRRYVAGEPMLSVVDVKRGY